MTASSSEIAFLQLGLRRVVVGRGPFECVAEPPKSRSAFYWNDFDLSDPLPWKIPAHFEVRSDLGVASLGPAPEILWNEPARQPFADAFDRVCRAFQNGSQLEKIVPVVTERGQLLSGDLRSLAVGAVAFAGEKAQAYGRWTAEDGMIGITPERFLVHQDGVLETMALAGTSSPAERECFTTDPKQIREHALVVDGIRRAINEPIHEEERTVLELDGLLHFLTHLRWETSQPVDLNGLIRQLHPTPAIGYLPRSSKASAVHQEIREQLQPPPNFATPFGWLHEGRFLSVVAIRHLSWQGANVSLPAGCGLIPESRLELEWSELALKRRAVKQLLRL